MQGLTCGAKLDDVIPMVTHQAQALARELRRFTGTVCGSGETALFSHEKRTIERLSTALITQVLEAPLLGVTDKYCEWEGAVEDVEATYACRYGVFDWTCPRCGAYHSYDPGD